jgi:hypothetical protein
MTKRSTAFAVDSFEFDHPRPDCRSTALAR